MPRLRHLNHYNTARAINFTCFHRYYILRSENVIRLFLIELERARQVHAIKILGYVIMPNHVHLVLHPPERCQLGRVIGEIKARSAGRMLTILRAEQAPILSRLRTVKNGKARTSFWQARCYDHNCRNSDSIREKINYCHLNPVRAGLVADPAAWRWSSFRWYHGLDDIALEIDGIEL